MRSRLSSSSPVIVALLLALGCAPSNPGVIIEGVSSPDDMCLFMPGETFRLSGRLDTATLEPGNRPEGITFIAGLQVANQMMNRGNYVYPLMSDPNGWYAREAEIELRGVDGMPLSADVIGDLSARFRVPVAGGLVSSAGSVDDPGRNIVMVPLIPATYGERLAGRTGTIVAAVRLNGITTGDSVQNTGEFTFPIELCVGCLQHPRVCVVDANCVQALQGCYPVGQDSEYSNCTAAAIDLCIADMMMMAAP